MSKIHADHGVLESILRFNQDRKPALLRLKLRRMKHDPFMFFRGADHLYGLAWPEIKPIDGGPDILICGDLHLENFGSHRTTEGDYRYDINDFDEAVIGPCGFDLVRCATSMILASELWRLRPSQATWMVLAYLANYRKTMLDAAEEDPVHESGPHGGHGPIQELLGSTVIATQADLLRSRIRREANGKPVIRRGKTLLNVSGKRFKKVRDALESYGETLGKAQAFKVHDVVFRVAGVGSLGVRRYLALIEGDGPPDGYHLLDIKEARASAVAACATEEFPQSEGDEARRVVLAQTVLQGHLALGLDVLEIGSRSYRIREMIPAENRSSLDRFQQQPSRLLRAVEAAGRLTARSHLRGACFKPELNRRPDLVRWAASPSLDAVLAAAARFTERTNRAFAEFRAAIQAAGGVTDCLQTLAR